MSDVLSLAGIRPRVAPPPPGGGTINIQVRLYDLDNRLEVLHALREPLAKALERAGGTHTLDDVADAIRAGRAQLFGDANGACVTELVTYPRRKVLNVWLGVGELDACLGLLPAMEAFASANGATGLTVVGRKGWERSLERHGWKTNGLVMAKELP